MSSGFWDPFAGMLQLFALNVYGLVMSDAQNLLKILCKDAQVFTSHHACRANHTMQCFLNNNDTDNNRFVALMNSY